MRYKPTRVSNNAVNVSTTLRVGAVTRYNPAGGAVVLTFPDTPEPHDTVTIKNSTADPATVRLDPNGNTFEVPNTSDTTYLTTGTYDHSGPKQSHRWIYDGVDTWWIDHSYKPNEERAVLVTGDYTLKRPGEIVLVDLTTAIDDITITVPAGWPDDSKFTVTKVVPSEYAVILQASGVELFEPTRIPSSTFSPSFILIYQGEAVSYCKEGNNWYAYANSIDTYTELYYLPVTPVDLTPGGDLLDITLHPSWNRSLLFSSVVGGVLTSAHDMLVSIEVQAVFEHNLTGNNADVWGRVYMVTDSTNPNNIVVPIDAAFAHSRSGTYGDTRTSNSLVVLATGNTIGIYGEEIDSSSGSTDVMGLLLSFRV